MGFNSEFKGLILLVMLGIARSFFCLTVVCVGVCVRVSSQMKIVVVTRNSCIQCFAVRKGDNRTSYCCYRLRSGCRKPHYRLRWVHTCNVTAYRNTVWWQCGRDSCPRNVSKVGYAVTLRACSVCCRYLAVASKRWYGYDRSKRDDTVTAEAGVDVQCHVARPHHTEVPQEFSRHSYVLRE